MTDNATQTHLSIRAQITKLDRKRRDYLGKAADVQKQIDALQHDLVTSLKDYMAEMGVQATVRNPRPAKPSTCSICISKGLSGVGHTAARHHVLVVQGEIKEPDQP